MKRWILGLILMTSLQSGAAGGVSWPEGSLYDANIRLLNQNGEEVEWASLAGSPVVISMAYTGCTYTCPLILSHMQSLEEALKKEGKKGTRFVLVSFDHKNDTPAVLKAYLEKRKLGSNWMLLTAKTEKEPRLIGNLLGIQYRQVSDRDFSHSFIISVMDKNGVIKGKISGADKDPKELAKFVP